MNYRGPYYKKYAVELTSVQETMVTNAVGVPKFVDLMEVMDRDVLRIALHATKYSVMNSSTQVMRALNDELRVIPWWVTS